MLLKISVIVAHMHFQSLESFAGFVTKITVEYFARILMDISHVDIERISSGETFTTSRALTFSYN